MRKIIIATLLLLPFAGRAQLTAPAAGGTATTNQMTGKVEMVYAFFDTTPFALNAKHSAGDTAEFTWMRLNVPAKKLDTVFVATGITSSTLDNTTFPLIDEGGYQVIIKSLTDTSAAIDTFTTWAFRDVFKVDDVTYVTECNGTRLDIISTPSLYATYVYYSFPSTRYPFRQYTFQGITSVEWTTSVNIHEGVDNPDESWATRKSSNTIVGSPPPLKDATYTINVQDFFGKPGSYTTGTIPAIAAYAKISAKEIVDGQEKELTDLTAVEGEALYHIQFSQEKSLNAQEFYWKGFGDENNPYTKDLVMWKNYTTNINQWIIPQVPYKNQMLDGYVPGKYSVRLTVRNTVSGCADSADVKSINVKPSSFSKEAIPNAFTPNGDGNNDVFTFVKGKEPVSMERINVYIYNRSGGLVYKYEGSYDGWTGWNGKMKNTGSDVADGVYYYVINGVGWDDIQYNTSDFKGALHIFR